jgi:hypothetical protein
VKRAGVRGWFVNRFLYFTTRYGYNPSLALVWMLGVVMLGYLGVHFAYVSGMIVPSVSAAQGAFSQSKPSLASCPNFHASLYAIDALLPLDLGQQSRWQLRNTGRWEYIGLQFLRLFYFLAAYLFAIIAGAGFTGLIKMTVRTE